jgi:Uma2 family endonuclease
MVTVQTGLTLEEFLTLPEEKPALEYLDGVVTQKMAPVGPHGKLQFTIAKWLDRASGEGEIAETFTELRANWVDRASLVPDVSVYLVERVPTTPDGDIDDQFWVPPDIAVEVASPGQSINELTTRAKLLLANGVRAVLVVDRRPRQVRLARPGRPIVTFRGEDVVTVEDVLPGFAFVVQDLFAALRVRRPGSRPAR